MFKNKKTVALIATIHSNLFNHFFYISYLIVITQPNFKFDLQFFY